MNARNRKHPYIFRETSLGFMFLPPRVNFHGPNEKYRGPAPDKCELCPDLNPALADVGLQFAVEATCRQRAICVRSNQFFKCSLPPFAELHCASNSLRLENHSCCLWCHASVIRSRFDRLACAFDKRAGPVDNHAIVKFANRGRARTHEKKWENCMEETSNSP